MGVEQFLLLDAQRPESPALAFALSIGFRAELDDLVEDKSRTCSAWSAVRRMLAYSATTESSV
jgi:hypothetical protein